ncbi:MAG: sugar phosphate nucleotidyltransferase [Candidatus Saccharibacteria bacterium]|nr:sugar phosphate nucleotidyltransferase [Candidatus Saccharibacteria bacterium]
MERFEKTLETIKEHGYIVVVAGGGGTRLFPLSHPDCPKQFCQLDADNTFVQASVRRFVGVGFKARRIIVVTTNPRQTELAKQQLLPLGILSQNICEISPEFGYAGAMVWAAHFVKSLDENAVILNTPADQYIVSDDEFKNTVMLAMENAEAGRPTIVGVKVNDLVTVMGCGHAAYDGGEEGAGLRKVTHFVEKPDRETADKLMREDSSACNTGINCWTVSTLLERVPGEPHKLETDELMEALGDIDVAVGKFQWHDCGTLKSLWEISKKTPNHKNASLGAEKGQNIIDRTNCTGSLFLTIPGVDLFAANIHDTAIAINEIDGKIVIVGVRFDHSQTVRTIADDFARYRDILSEDFSVGARNNRVVATNMSNLEAVGFVGVENCTISAIRYPDGHVVVTVGCDEKAN